MINIKIIKVHAGQILPCERVTGNKEFTIDGLSDKRGLHTVMLAHVIISNPVPCIISMLQSLQEISHTTQAGLNFMIPSRRNSKRNKMFGLSYKVDEVNDGNTIN